MTDNACSVRILVVDDDEKCLASLRRILHGHCEVITTTDPVQALKIFELQGPFAVVISDFRMPFMNGIELFSRLQHLDRHVQRIMLTGHAELQMAIDAVNHGKITAFLTKPTPAVSIRAVLTDAIQAYNASRLAAGLRSERPEGNLSSGSGLSNLYAPLTVKEKEVLVLLSQGFSNKEIAEKLSITVGTVKSHLNNLFGKMGVNNRTKIVARGIELGLLKS